MLHTGEPLLTITSRFKVMGCYSILQMRRKYS